jgi:hypothetical protein
MSIIGYYFLILALLLIISFYFWIAMQNNFKREILYGWISTIGFIISIVWILSGIFIIIKNIF